MDYCANRDLTQLIGDWTMPGTHKVRDLYRLLVRLERFAEKNRVPEYESFWTVCISCIKSLIELTEKRNETTQKLAKATERKVEKLVIAGWTEREISNEVGIAKSTIWKIKKKKGLFINHPKSKQLSLFGTPSATT